MFLRAQKLLLAIAQPCQGHGAKALPGAAQAAVRHCWSSKATWFLQLTRQSSQFELRASPVTGCKSQMLKWPQLLPRPCSTLERFCSLILPSHGAMARTLQAGATGQGQWAERGFAEVPASSHSPRALQPWRNQQQLCKHTQSTALTCLFGNPSR